MVAPVARPSVRAGWSRSAGDDVRGRAVRDGRGVVDNLDLRRVLSHAATSAAVQTAAPVGSTSSPTPNNARCTLIDGAADRAEQRRAVAER